MPSWTPGEEQRIQGMVSTIVALAYPRIVDNRLRKLRLDIESLKASAKRHPRQEESGGPWRREVSVLREVIRRVEDGRMESDSDEDI